MKDDVQHCSTCGTPMNTVVKPMHATPHDAGTLFTGRMMHVSRLATIGEMASGIAHEINQPLAAITNYAQASVRLLNSPALDMADIREALQEISAQAQRAGDIIRRMRSLARHNDTERVQVSANALIQEISDLLQADARAHDAQLTLKLQPDLPCFSGDRVQIQHVLLNLMRNALEAIDENPLGQREVVLGTTRTANGDVELFVQDNGPGLTQAAVDRLSEPFFTTKPNGTGLGLAISNTIMRAHAGEFGYRPNLPRGACFYLHLPPITDES
jgi:two-component system, LuxR family, sensor kinase FixL